MAMPPIEMEDEDLEAAPEDDMAEEDGAMAMGDMSADIDPMFAADIAEAFPDLDDAQIAALQRAVLSLIAGGGAPPAGGDMPF